ncbi:hypothetical protein G6F57_019821 [Rhizopus arrhizus]|nr:hypothetical protein G6F57_019821 [Rhizopus arrhizus]
MALPKWAVGFVDPAWLKAVQGGLEWVSQSLVQILPAANGLGALVTTAGWIVWAIVVAGLLLLAFILARRGSTRRVEDAASSRAGSHSSRHKRSGH